MNVCGFLKENLNDSYKELSIPFHQKAPMNSRKVEGSGGRVERKTAGNPLCTGVRVWDTDEEDKRSMTQLCMLGCCLALSVAWYESAVSESS